MIIRPYQREAVEAAFREWEEVQSTLICLPTGAGKTICACEIIKRFHPRRAIFLCHRSELVFQAVKSIEKYTGYECSIEMADFRATTTFWNKSPVVISTIQTQIAGNGGNGRMQKFSPDDFGILICDESHHAVSPTWKRVIEHYKKNKNLKILNLTATPDRADQKALGEIIDSVAFDYEVVDAINDGWLVPIHQQLVEIEGLDFSQVKTTAGDLNGAELAEIMEAEKNLQGIASASLQIIGARRSLVFAASVKHAEMLSEIFNRHRADMSSWVCGKTPKDERADILKKFDNGVTQIVVNVGVLTEGYDSPGVECIIQARPTKSRCLFSQMVGRATRPLPGIVDGLETAEERKQSILHSAKPNCLVVDFVGNSGRHKLITTADILGGKFSDEEIELAEKNAREKNAAVDMADELENAREEIEESKRKEAARKARLVATATFRIHSINPFDILEMKPERERGWDSGKQLTAFQKAMLNRNGIDASGLSYHQQKQILVELFRRLNEKLATFKQVKLLKKHGYDTKETTMKQASNLIDDLAKAGWNRARADEIRRLRELDALPAGNPF